MQSPQHRDLAGQRLDLVLDEARSRVALAFTDGLAGREPSERLDLIEPEAEVLEGQCGRDVSAVLDGVLTRSAGRAAWLRQDAQLFVVADRPAANPGSLGQLTDADHARVVVADSCHKRRYPRPRALSSSRPLTDRSRMTTEIGCQSSEESAISRLWLVPTCAVASR